MLRVIAGKYRNRWLEQPNLSISRPTTDKVREAVFSSLQFKIPNSKCLDLFSGSGAWAIEAASREAAWIDAIEVSKEATKIIQNNISELKIPNIALYTQDALVFLANTNNKYDYIFIDAPYKNYNLVNQALELIATKKILNSNGEIIIETDVVKNIIMPKNLEIYKQKRHGKINLLYVYQVSN